MDCWVVMVDEDIISLTRAKKILTENGMRVSLLNSGRDLLKFMKNNTPDLILLDVIMSEMDGFQTYHALRQLEKKAGRKQTPVIFITGTNDIQMERRGLNAGAADFIRKPFQKDIMIRRIYNIVTNAKIIESLMDEASVDKLTGFWNRAAGTRRIRKSCKIKEGTMAILDLDNFKLINDLHGHDIGDRILEAFAITIRQNTRGKDIIARIGGDEFIAFFTNLGSEDGLAAMIQRLNEQLMQKAAAILGGTLDIPLGISMGAVKVPDYGRDYGSLFTLADSALYRAKHNGKHGYVMYFPEEAPVSQQENLQQQLNRITQIVEERSDRGGALLLDVEQFSFVYRFIKRFYSRYGGNACRFLFVLSCEDGEKMKEVTEQFGEYLQKTLRRSDIILHNKLNQFFLFLPELEEQDVHAVETRIMKAWESSSHGNDTHIEYMFETTRYERK